MSEDRSIESIDQVLGFAKLSPSENLSTTQILYFNSENVHNNTYRLLELDDHLMEKVKEGNSIYIKGEDDESAVLCTEKNTYNILQADTSNSLLLAKQLRFVEELKDHTDRTTNRIVIHNVFHDYLELVLCKPHINKLKDLLKKTVYKGPEYEYTIDKDALFSYTDLLNRIQSSEEELNVMLESLETLEIDGKIRILDFEYRFRILSYMLKLIEENSWSLDAIDYEETLNTLTELAPYEVINSLFDLYTEQSKMIDGVQLYKYKEIPICKFFALVLLHNAGKFHLNEFLQAWTESVPEGMEPKEEMLYGVALINRNSSPPVIQAYPEDLLPETIVERFNELFKAKEKWTALEISPYIQ